MDPEKPEMAGKPEPPRVAITPRKATIPSSPGAGANREASAREEARWARRNRICPKAPKDPFLHPSKSMELPGSLQNPGSYVPRHDGKGRGLLAFFRHRRKGRSRILNLILLPIAVLVVFLAILFLFKFL